MTDSDRRLIRRWPERRQAKVALMLRERRGKPIVLPVIAVVLALFLVWRDAGGEVVHGINKQGAWTCWTDQGPLLRFCMIYTRERR